MSFGDYELFDAVVRAGSLSAGGRSLGISPAMVSKRLSKLEARLGVQLIRRTTRRLEVTEAGAAFHERISSAIALAREAETVAAGAIGEPAGRLRISAPTSFGRLHVAPLLGEFLASHPRVELEFDLSDGYVNLVGGGYDVAVRICAQPGTGLAAHRLADNERILCASPQYLLERGSPIDLRDLAGHQLLAAHEQLPWRLDGPSGPVTVSGQSLVRTNSSEVVRELALAGAGIALRSNWDVETLLRDGRLVRVLGDYRGAQDIAIFLVYPRSPFVPHAVRVFQRFLCDRLKVLTAPGTPAST